MGYRDDLDGYDPDRPPPEPPETTRRAPRRRPRRAWVFRVGVGVLIVAAALRLTTAGGDDEGTATPKESAAVETTTPEESSATVPPPNSSSAETTPDRSGSSSSSSTSESEAESPRTGSNRRAAQRAAEDFLTEWARPKRAPGPWYEAVRPLATPTFGNALRSVNPVNVPVSKVERVRAEEVTATSGQFLATTDGPRVRVLVQRSGTEWLVSGVEPVRQVDGGGA